MILEHDLMTNEATKAIFDALPRTSRIIDVGCGIRPFPVFPCKFHICIEPCEEYRHHLWDWNPGDRIVWIQPSEAEGLSYSTRLGATVLLIDVIEHMEKERGERIRDLAEEFEHAVIFTPLGWYPQDEETPDCWGLNGGYWQKHRSAWQPEDFPNWKVHVWEHWHPKNGVGAILAIR